MATSSKRERFEKVATTRVQKIINMLGLLQNCANTNNYEYDDEDDEFDDEDEEFKAEYYDFMDKEFAGDESFEEGADI